MRWFLTGFVYRQALEQIVNEKGFDGLLPRLLWRRLSIPLGFWIANRYPRVNPNWITATAVILGLLSASVWGSAAAHSWLFLWGGILLQVSNFVDGLDGDVARALCVFPRSPARKRWGMFIDTLGDRLVDAALLIGLGVYLDAVGISSRQAVLLVAFALASTLISTFSRHVVREAYAPFTRVRPYASGAVDSAGRSLRLLILTLGAFGEFGYALAYGPQGIVIAVTLLFLSGLQLFQVFFRAYELKKNLNAVCVEE